MKRSIIGLITAITTSLGGCLVGLILVVVIAYAIFQTFLAIIYAWLYGPIIPPTIHGIPTTGVITATFQDAFYLELFGFEHYGLDIGNNAMPLVFSTVDEATVITVGFDEDGWGNYVILEDNQSPGWRVVYAHLHTVAPTIIEGRSDVTWGEDIGRMGSTGNSTGTHLHYEIHAPDGIPVDPEGSADCCGGG